MVKLLLHICVFVLLSSSVMGWPNDKESLPGIEPQINNGYELPYTIQSWQTEHGLPQNSIRAIVQTRDGYLWMGTQEGLARFDGKEFYVVDRSNSTLANNDVLALAEDSADKALWIGTVGGLFRMEDENHIRWVRIHRRWNDLAARILLADSLRHGLWVGTWRGLFFLKQGDTIATHYSLQHGLMSDRILSLGFDEARNLLVGTPVGAQRFSDGKFTLLHDSLKGIPAFAFCAMKNGLMVGTGGRGIAHVEDGQLRRWYTNSDNGLPSDVVRSLQYDAPEGSLWIGCDGGGLGRMRDGIVHVFRGEGISTESLWSLLLDHEGSLWVGTYGNGVLCVRSSAITPFHLNAQLSGRNISTIIQDRHDGSVWIGTSGGGVNHIKDGIVKRYWGSRGNMIRALYQDRKGAIWIGTEDGGLAVARNEKFTWYDRYAGLPANLSYAIGEDDDGTLLVASTAGPLMAKRGERFAPFRCRDGDTLVNITLIGRGKKSDALYILEDGQYLHRIQGGTCIERDIGSLIIRRGRILSFVEDDREDVWFATGGNGILRMRGNSVSTVTAAQGLFNNGIHQILIDQFDRVWMSSNKGLSYVPLQELTDLLDGKLRRVTAVSFGASDGMPSRECNGASQPSGFIMSDGRLWFPTVKGIAVVDPQNMRKNLKLPPVTIQQIFIDRKSYDWREQTIIAAPGSGDLEVKFAGLSFLSADKVQYKYQLEGFDPEWVSVGSRREAFYTNIPPGHYNFRVMASNNDGVWNETGATVTLILQPHFYQTWWFYALCMLAVVMVGVSIHHFYRNYRDREQIASRLQSELALTQLEMLKTQLKPHFLFNTLNTIMVYIKENPDIAEQMVAQLSDLLRVSINHRHEHQVPLRMELEILNSYLEIQRVRFEDRLQLTMEIDPNVTDALVPPLLLQPLVENAITHGFADSLGPWKLEVHARRRIARLELEVRDNGSGFPQPLNGELDKGIGLFNTRTRLKYLYGDNYRFDISNHPNGGASILISIPYTIKYHIPELERRLV